MSKGLKTKSNIVLVAAITGWLGIVMREAGWEFFGNAVFNISLIIAAVFGVLGLIGLAINFCSRKNK
ncbi:hypothetical protein [Halomonas sp. BC04]|uniref:hypothetical protein n=1 Tax=Halomonas sp. BC04 TaxID=1403540 RepID=UPI0012DD80B9|nr:hypothetical protein [Halomonas sp. BC04]